MALDIETTEHDGGWLIKVKGEVDLYASPELRVEILKTIPKTNRTLGVDLSQVEYMDSSGVATLVEGLKLAGKNNTAFALVAPSQAVMKVLELSKLDSVFDIRESL